jgi:DNA adenine methylase
MTTITRPIIRYHGGKFRLAPWIIGHFPAHRIYVEPFGGGGSVLLRKPRSYAEIYNDLDGEIVNVFRAARDNGCALANALELTPFSRDEFVLSYHSTDNDIEQARRTIFRSFAGFGSASACGKKSGFRANSNRSGTTPAHDWRNYPDAFRNVIARLQGVVIENRDALECMVQHDTPETLHYVDPPYVHDTRSLGSRTKAYKHEMDDQQHIVLLVGLKKLTGKVIVSGYRCELYDDLLAGWHRIDRVAHADGARERVESLWISPNADQDSLFNRRTA